MSATEGSSTEEDWSGEASPAAAAEEMELWDRSQPTAAVGIAIQQFDEKYGTTYSTEDDEDEEDEEDLEGSGEAGGSGPSGGHSDGNHFLSPGARNVFERWLLENPTRRGRPSAEDVAAMAVQATSEGGKTVTERQVRCFFNNKYVLLKCSVRVVWAARPIGPIAMHEHVPCLIRKAIPLLLLELGIDLSASRIGLSSRTSLFFCLPLACFVLRDWLDTLPRRRKRTPELHSSQRGRPHH